MFLRLFFSRIFLTVACFCPIFSAQQLTQGCSNDSSCFSYPTNCQGSGCQIVYKWSSSQDDTAHHFSLAAKIPPDLPSNSIWLAVGFSTDQLMGNDDIVLCKSQPSSFSVDHYFSLGESTPGLMDSTNPRIGITNPNLVVNNGALDCSFNRQKFLNVAKYFDLRSQTFYLFAAMGPLDQLANIAKHSFKVSSRNVVDFSAQANVVADSAPIQQVKVKTHASFMIIAWLIFSSIGILLARYYKFIFSERRIYKLKIWFVLHRPIMLSVFVLSIIGLLVIVADKGWKWVSQSSLPSFVHSIFGMVTLGIAFLQIIVAIFRPNQEHRRRFIFNYAHRILGFSTLISSIITLFIGVSLDRVNLKMTGVGIMIAWTLWIIVFMVVIEFIERQFKKKMFNLNLSYLDAQDFTNMHRKNNLVDQAQYQLESIKTIFLFLHILVAFGLAIVLIYFVAIAQVR